MLLVYISTATATCSNGGATTAYMCSTCAVVNGLYVCIAKGICLQHELHDEVTLLQLHECCRLHTAGHCIAWGCQQASLQIVHVFH